MNSGCLEIEVVCYIDKKCRKSMGRKWEPYVAEIFETTSELVSSLLGLCVILRPVKIAVCGEINTSRMIYKWNGNKKLRKRYFDFYGNYRVKEIFIIDTVLKAFRAWVISTDFSELGKRSYKHYLHVAFLDLYAYSGGGIAARGEDNERLPIIIVHRSSDLRNYAGTLAHELLHTLGASHSKTGIMRSSYPIDISHLDGKTRASLRRKLLRRIKNRS